MARIKRLLPKSRGMKILLTIILVLIAIRAALPAIVLSELNKFLGEFSPVYEAHIGDLDISLIRGAYSLENISVKLKESQKEFLKVNDVDVSVAWREIIRLRLTADVLIKGADFLLTKELMDIAKTPKAKNTETIQTAKKKIFKLNIERVDIKDSSVSFAENTNIPLANRLRLDHIDARLSHIIADKVNSNILYTLRGTLMNSSTLKVAGKLRQGKPLAWDADIELRDFDLAAANPFLKSHIPVTFTSGKLDLYSEAKSENNVIDGYAKPFIKNLDVIRKNEHFLGAKHFGIEIGSALANLILRDKPEKTVATRVKFRLANKKLDLDVPEAISKSIEHGFNHTISPGLDNSVNL